ncbi:Hypothetical protein NTJ_02715 [Nesidiocoris tenuis]|uniref:Uncharacterized protein n=1 Tax=Nesidiocoris tenuis TaxID=355587 RepID=A0ABN7AC94_9HEMI|nr:Hypothetical protein NTJ_02715 [Nesidiocoris tenuis]
MSSSTALFAFCVAFAFINGAYAGMDCSFYIKVHRMFSSEESLRTKALSLTNTCPDVVGTISAAFSNSEQNKDFCCFTSNGVECCDFVEYLFFGFLIPAIVVGIVLSLLLSCICCFFCPFCCIYKRRNGRVF